ncbi:GbsR/MarR family transcriptional regulator [Oceanobacillus senegalensis]|uniref:GbsR/MarR family transcriptional regulator n=1 Tax=Oceanobacillus senegalensis TaxID=1936063 RepID=UPI000A30F84E|nr:MarR family transcriptional regulator [Oceanobacillus senegalensis]
MSITENEKIMQNIMIEFTKTVEMFGLNPMESRLFSYLYLSGNALTLDDMGEALGKSKTSMSTNIRSLLDLNLVTRVWKKGVRKDLYKANSPLYKSFMDFYLKKWKDAMIYQKRSLEDIQHQLDEGPIQHYPSTELLHTAERLREIIDFHKELEALFQRINKE